MERAKRIRLVIVGALGFAILCLFLSACANYSTDGSAAKVNDVSISEDAVTAKVQAFRQESKLTGDEAWQNYLKKNNTNSKKIRNKYLDELIDDEVYKQLAAQNNITSTSLDVLKYKVNQIFIQQAKPSKEAYSQLLVSYAEKFNGSKGYYRIMIPVSREAEAQQVYSQVKSGALDFREAILQQQENDPEKVNLNYIVYDCFMVSPDEVKATLANLHTGQMSDLIKTEKYFYILNVVDEISCDVPLTSLSSLSEFTQENFRYYAKTRDQENVVKTEFATAKKDFNITKYDPPKDLPY